MSTVLWIVQGVLAFAFLGAGMMKLSKPREELAESGMEYVEDFSDGQIKAIGALELLGGIGVLLPSALGVVPILSGVAAVGLALTMAGAALTHISRGEYPMIAVNLLLGGMAAFVAYHVFV